MNPQQPLRGVALFCGATLLFACLDATSKHLSAVWPIGILAWGRYLTHWGLMTTLLAPRWQTRLIRCSRPLLVTVRGLLLVLVTVLMMTAFSRMPLAEATAIGFASPLLVTLAAGPVLGEPIGRLRWAAVLVGLIGVLVLTRPGSGLDPWGTLAAITSAVAFAAYQLLTRQLSATEHPVTLLYVTALAGTVTLSLALPWLGAPPDDIGLRDIVQIASLGVFGGAGHYLLTRAFHHAPASLLSPLIYTQLIWAGLFGWVLFDDTPDAGALGGMAIIGLAGMMIAVDGHRTARAAPPPSADRHAAD